jgi:hypothetical protein
MSLQFMSENSSFPLLLSILLKKLLKYLWEYQFSVCQVLKLNSQDSVLDELKCESFKNQEKGQRSSKRMEFRKFFVFFCQNIKIVT